MSELVSKFAGELAAEIAEKQAEVDHLREILAVVGVGTPTIANIPTPAPAKAKPRKKGGKRRGRPSDAQKAAELGITVEELRAQRAK